MRVWLATMLVLAGGLARPAPAGACIFAGRPDHVVDPAEQAVDSTRVRDEGSSGSWRIAARRGVDASPWLVLLAVLLPGIVGTLGRARVHAGRR